jgi:bacterioferritin-associated ferredoxin
MEDDMIICICRNITTSQVEEAIEEGKTFEDLRQELDLCGGCGSCFREVDALFNEDTE